ncbi:MAG: hypothetical protein AB7O96_03120 [Pseudobdellovibrionaceae bacterium]
MSQNLWFKKKSYGWGWTPASWQGWVATFIYTLLVIGYPLLGEFGFLKYEGSLFTVLLLISTVAFIVLCYKKGEKPSWSWGPKN